MEREQRDSRIPKDVWPRQEASEIITTAELAGRGRWSRDERQPGSSRASREALAKEAGQNMADKLIRRWRELDQEQGRKGAATQELCRSQQLDAGELEAMYARLASGTASMRDMLALEISDIEMPTQGRGESTREDAFELTQRRAADGSAEFLLDGEQFTSCLEKEAEAVHRALQDMLRLLQR